MTYLVISLVKLLLSRNFCQKYMRVNFRNFHSVSTVLLCKACPFFSFFCQTIFRTKTYLWFYTKLFTVLIYKSGFFSLQQWNLVKITSNITSFTSKSILDSKYLIDRISIKASNYYKLIKSQILVEFWLNSSQFHEKLHDIWPKMAIF